MSAYWSLLPIVEKAVANTKLDCLGHCLSHDLYIEPQYIYLLSSASVHRSWKVSEPRKYIQLIICGRLFPHQRQIESRSAASHHADGAQEDPEQDQSETLQCAHSNGYSACPCLREIGMQIKNRIQMLEKAIIESGAVTRLDLSLSEDSATKYDGATSGLQSGLTSSGDGEAALETVSQNLSSWDVNFCLDLANDTDFSASPESSKNLKQPDSIFDTGSSLLSRPGSDMQSNEFHLDHHHHQFVSPWQSPPERKTQSPALTLTPRVDLINEAGRLPQPKRGNPDSGLTRGRPRKVSSTGLGIEVIELHTIKSCSCTMKLIYHRLDGYVQYKGKYRTLQKRL